LVNQQETKKKLFMKFSNFYNISLGPKSSCKTLSNLKSASTSSNPLQYKVDCSKNSTIFRRPYMESVGSSETIRKTPLLMLTANNFKSAKHIYTQPFNFTNSKQFLPQHIKSYSLEFLTWFVGFSESDGSFIISNNRLFFTITQQDAALLARLRTQLGFGTICNDTKYPDIKRFTVTDRSHIKNLIHIFNGNLLLKKTTQRFSLWVNHYNLLTNENIPILSRWNTMLDSDFSLDFSKFREKLSPDQIQQLRSESVVWNTAWLTGFLEAQGSFSAVQPFKHQKLTIEMRILLDQTNELQVLLHIRELLGDIGSIWIRKKVDEKIQYRFQVSNWEALQLFVKYLEIHKLRSKKKIVYVRWKKLFNFLGLIKLEKQKGNPISSEKREQKIKRLVLETKKSFLEQERAKKIIQEVEDRVPL
jgi:hypothetical protein